MKGQDEIKRALALCPGDSLECEQDSCPYWDIRLCVPELHIDALELLKEQEAMNIDVFVQWCIDSHIMGDATVRGIKYWVGKYKEIKEGR